MSNDITELRKHLFKQMERLNQDDVDLEKEKERTSQLIQVADSFVRISEVENQLINIVSDYSSAFIPAGKIEGVPGNGQPQIESGSSGHSQTNPTDDDLSDEGMVNYGGRMVSKRTLGQHKSTHAPGD